MLYRLRQARDAAGLRQEEVSAALGRRQTFVSDIEMGKRELSVQTLLAMARALGVDPARLVGPVVEAVEAKLHYLTRDAVLRARREGRAPPVVWQAIEAGTGTSWRYKRGRH